MKGLHIGILFVLAILREVVVRFLDALDSMRFQWLRFGLGHF